MDFRPLVHVERRQKEITESGYGENFYDHGRYIEGERKLRIEFLCQFLVLGNSAAGTKTNQACDERKGFKDTKRAKIRGKPTYENELDEEG